jgi:hypothetical protein
MLRGGAGWGSAFPAFSVKFKNLLKNDLDSIDWFVINLPG